MNLSGLVWTKYTDRLRCAARWFVRIRSGRLDPLTDKSFGEWLKQSDNEAHYERCELSWALTSELAQQPQIKSLLRDADRLVAHYRQTGAPENRSKPWWSDFGRWEGLRKPAIAAAALCLVGLAGRLAFMALHVEEYHTATGEQRALVLQDGSVVTLNTASKVRIRYSRTTRLVELERGEALFSVKKNPARPFEVQAQGGITRAVGTQFAVQVTGIVADVSVLEGTVAVFAGQPGRQAESPTRLTAGQAIAYVPGGPVSTTRQADISRIRAWQAQRIEFNDTTLGTAIEDYNRYSKIPLVLASRELAGRRISGAFGIGDEEALLNALKQILPVAIEKRQNEIVILARQ